MNKNYHVITTEDFKFAIRNIYNYNFLSNHSKKQFQKLLLEKYRNLKMFPYMYPKIQKSDYRKIPIQNYLIIYRVENTYIKFINIIPQKSNYYNQSYIRS